MSAAHPAGRCDPLSPVREALLVQVRADADRLVAEADEEAYEAVARARVEAEEIRAAARAQGEADAARVLVSERARARRKARACVLTAQRSVYTGLRATVLGELPGLRADPAYGPWCDRLRAQVQEVLGADAHVAESPHGGVVGEAGGRRVEYTLVGLADQALDALGVDVEGLWAQ